MLAFGKCGGWESEIPRKAVQGLCFAFMQTMSMSWIHQRGWGAIKTPNPLCTRAGCNPFGNCLVNSLPRTNHVEGGVSMRLRCLKGF